ncbi:MAG: CHRD domain-containing protein [Acidobacteriota bacterium]
MKRLIASIAVMALTIVSVASIMMRSARADIVVFTAQLLASNEVPPVSNADLNAFGSVTVTVDTATNLYRFDWSVGGVAASSIILSHIHEAPAGVNGPVRVDSLISPATAIAVVGGNAAFSRSGLSGPADVTTRILANPAGFYFNIHSNLNPGGVVRGQLVRQAATAAGGAPTLSEWGAILMGLLIIAACMFFLLGRSKTSMALPGGSPSTAFEGPMKADWRLLASVTLYVEAAIVLALIVLSARTVDIAGALTSGLVVAFILHLFIGAARRR